MRGDDGFETLQRAVDSRRLALAYGMTNGQKAHLSAALSRESGRPILLVAANDGQAARFFDDLTQFMKDGVYLLSTREMVFYDAMSSHELQHRRVETLYAMATGAAKAVVVSAEGLRHRLMPLQGFLAYCREIAVGDVISQRDLAAFLVNAGYERVERVEAKGQFTIRGGIADVFPVTSSSAYRVEWFDDEIDSIRLFEVSTQRSNENLRKAALPPAAEMLFPDEAHAGFAKEKLEAALADALTKKGHTLSHARTVEGERDTLPGLSQLGDKAKLQLGYGSSDEKLAIRMWRNIETAGGGMPFPHAEMYANLLYAKTETAREWLGDAIVLLDEPDKLQDALNHNQMEFIESFKSALERGEILPAQADLLLPHDTLLSDLTGNGGVLYASMLKTLAGLSPQDIVHIEGVGATTYHNQFKELASDLAKWRRDGWRVILLSGGVARGERLCQNLEEFGVFPAVRPENFGGPLPDDPTILPLSLSRGFLYPGLRFAVVADADIYGAAYQKRKTKQSAGERIAAFTDLAVGDYVVHESHGVGVYKGTVRLQSEGLWRDYLLLQYQGNDKLYVPTDQMDRVQRYIGSDGVPPRVNKLGGGEWQRQKQRVKQSLKKVAFDLAQLYAARQAQKGLAFSKDTPWQQQFEDDFPFEETADQLRAIEEIKADMEKPIVMDRLLCGDVGYGKTEVALRAAYKAVMDGKQVAILTPTTVLAQQHFNTVKQRFTGQPIRFDVLSRFKTAAEQAEILGRVHSGEIDLLIGTHRLLSKDVHFRDLGLLIVDEEQRFGVQHKEMVKNIQRNVDVLTLSATPIPRTLHMSMIGIRDMSLLETPPEERYPVQTYVLEYSESLVRDAIIREMQRGGQVFVLYNRVDQIERYFTKLRELAPEARIGIGHGQMRESMLEDVMMDFFEGRYDVLLCTTIIESGLDVPNCNTLIVCDSDHFGLSQLYQLRGRVGRSNRLAYAYLTVPPSKVLSETADKRLSAIREFTAFGSGFRVAMRDLEIRGAGNLLGAEQHGFLSTIGYDMYCKLMEEAMREARGDTGETVAVETRVEYPVDAFLPVDYVPSDAQRIELYKRIASVNSRDAASDLLDEMTDRYGDPPKQAGLLLDIALLKSCCNRLGVDFVGHKTDCVIMRFAQGATPDIHDLLSAIVELDSSVVFSAKEPISLIYKSPRMTPEALLEKALLEMEKIVDRMRAKREAGDPAMADAGPKG